MALTENKSKGFSLIELMIATSILSFIIFSGYYAYSLFSGGWEKRANYYWQTSQNAIGLEALIRALESSTPYMVNNAQNKASTLFDGGKSELVFVSNSPIFNQGAALVQLLLVNIDGVNQLLYREKGLHKKPLLEWGNQQVEWEHSIVLISDITSLNFSYFGFVDFENAVIGYNIYEGISRGATTGLLDWQDRYDMKHHRVLPTKVNVQFRTLSGKNTDLTIDLPEHTIRNVLRYMREDF